MNLTDCTAQRGSTMRRKTLQMLIGLSGASWLNANAQSSAWPQKPVRWIVSQPAGAGPDIIARYLAEQLSKVWAQPVVVENRPGGQNVIGAQAAARSPADGYTFFYGTTAAMITNSFTFKTLPYDPEKDFIPVAFIGKSPFVIATNPASGFKNLGEVLAQVKAQPGKLAMATEGPKTFSGMLADHVAALGGGSWNHIPYTKAGDALQDVIGGRVPFVCLPEAALLSLVKNGQLVALAVSTSQRAPSLPQVPSIAETLRGFEFAGWNGLFAPSGTPADIVSKVNRDATVVLQQAETQARMLALGSIPDSGTSVDSFAAFMKSERERWAGIVKSIGIKAE